MTRMTMPAAAPHARGPRYLFQSAVPYSAYGAGALQTALTPQYISRAREVAAMLTRPADSVAKAVDLLEEAARKDRVIR